MTSGVDTFTQVIIVCRTLELRLSKGLSTVTEWLSENGCPIDSVRDGPAKYAREKEENPALPCKQPGKSNPNFENKARHPGSARRNSALFPGGGTRLYAERQGS